MFTQQFTDDCYPISKVVQIFGTRSKALVYSVIKVFLQWELGRLLNDSNNKDKVVDILDRWKNSCNCKGVQSGTIYLNSFILHIFGIYFDNEFELKIVLATVTPLGNLNMNTTRLLEG